MYIRVDGYHQEPTVFQEGDLFGPMSAAGDSGSLISIGREHSFHAAHLLFAGSDCVTIAVPMDTVEAEHRTLSAYSGGPDQSSP